MQEPITVSGIQLVRIGDYAVVNVELNGKWVEVIREHVEGSFSHIVEPTAYELSSPLRNVGRCLLLKSEV